MDPALYKAAVQGKIDPFQIYGTPLNRLLTPNRNTILHVYLENQRRTLRTSTDFVNRILETCPVLLLQANIKGEIPLHFAARYGHPNVVKVLIDRAKALPVDLENGLTEAKKMLRMPNGEKDTALHIAARNGWSDVVEILTKEDPDFSYSANDYGETPLYIATNLRFAENVSFWWMAIFFRARTGHRKNAIDKIIRNCKLVDYSGPNGRTALHAAVVQNDHESVKKILEKERSLTKATDQNGWLPLHYTAYFNGRSSITKLLLEYDVSAAYVVVTEKKITALHLAALEGNVKVMEAIVSACPSCCELVDSRGWNAVHYLLAYRKFPPASIRALQVNSKLGQLIYEKDYEGNSPLHLFAASGARLFNLPVGWQMSESGVNKDGLSVDDILEGNFPEKEKKILEPLADIEKGPRGRIPVRKTKGFSVLQATEARLVSAVLIATVTFAAAFTVPGGYKNEQAGPNQGSAILSKNAAFKAFVISDAMSMVLSLSAVFIHFFMSPYRPSVYNYFAAAFFLTESSMAAMVIAFSTGTYAVLAPSTGLAISTILIGLSFFLIVFIVLISRFLYVLGGSRRLKTKFQYFHVT